LFFTDFSIHKNNVSFLQRTEPSITEQLFDDVCITYSDFLFKKYKIDNDRFFVFGVLLGDARKFLRANDFLNCIGNYLIIKIRNKKIHIITNRLNTMHCYYSSAGIHTYFHNAIPGSRTLDWTGLGSYFNNGFFNNDRTFVNEVKLLLNASEYVFDSTITLISKNPYWECKHQVSIRTYTESVDEFARILENIKNDYIKLNGDIAMPISGGLDSRTITGLFSQNNEDAKKLWSYSYGFGPDSMETGIAEQVAKRRNLKFEKIATDNYLKGKIPLIQNCVEHFQYIDGTRQADISEKLQLNARYVVCAHWGDVWHDTMGYDSTYSLREFAVKKMKKKGAAWFMNAIDALKISAYETELAEAVDNTIEDKDFAIKIFKTLQWSQRWTLASTRMYQAGAFPIYPFYDNRVIDFFCSVPSVFVKGRRMQIDYLKKYHPDLARIRWEEYNSNLYWYKIINNRNIVYRVFDKIRRTISNKIKIYRNWELFYLNEDGKEMLQRNIVNNDALHKIIPKHKLKEFYQEFYKDPSAANGYTMSMLHTFALFTKRYFSE